MFHTISHKALGISNKEYLFTRLGNTHFSWFYCKYKKDQLPSQGWKLHISANVSNASDILKTVILYLVEHSLSFKHAYGIDDLQYLNSGNGGITQVGKFITIYFNNEFDFINHTNSLNQLFTSNYRVPFIITDKRFNNNGPLFYRYGAISSSEEQNEMGVFESILLDSNDNKSIDKREHSFYIPEGISDPFPESKEVNIDFSNKILKDRYVLLDKLFESYKAESFLVLDMLKGDFCFTKIAKSDIETENGIYSDDLLKHESTILATLNCNAVPKLQDYFTKDNRTIIVTEFIDGITLYDFIRLNAIKGLFLNKKQLKTIFMSILQNIKQLEKNTITHNDLKPSNILINKKLSTIIVDFETSLSQNIDNKTVTAIRTRGFYNKTIQGNPDYYSLGMILYFILTGYNISDAPREYDVLERPLHYLTGYKNSVLEQLITNLCSNKCESIETIINDFNNAITIKATTFKLSKSNLSETSVMYKKIAEGIVQWLFENSIENNNYIYWKSSHVFNAGEGRMDINIGSSGIVIFLSYYYKYCNNELTDKKRNKIVKAINYIISKKYNNQITGLFVGESGKMLATLSFCYSFNVLNNVLFTNNIQYIIDNVPKNDDFYNGKAGVGFLFLTLYKVTDNKLYLDYAITIANTIINNAEYNDTDIYWIDHLTQKHFLGFAHGIAGIGYFLTQLYLVSNNDMYLSIINNIAETLIRYSEQSNKPLLINWPDEQDQNISNNFWCNGTAGIAQFFLETYKITKNVEYEKILLKSVNTVTKCSSFLNPTMCHGLSGNINFLINYYQFSHDQTIKMEIFRLSEVLKMAGKKVNNDLLFHSESPFIVTPDFWVGFSGTAYIFLRLSDIENHLDFLSLEYYNQV
jgi:serine/threonine protein kinase